MYCISSFTETRGFMSPRSGVMFGIAFFAAGWAVDVPDVAGVDDFADEQDEASTLIDTMDRTMLAATAARAWVRCMYPDILDGNARRRRPTGGAGDPFWGRPRR